MVLEPPSADPSDSPQVAELKRQLYWAHLKIQLLEERLRLHRIQKYGPGSEKLSDAQLALLELEPGVSRVEVQAESEREPLPAPARKQHRSHPGRQELPAELPRMERVLACTPEQCTCPACGRPTLVIGYDQSEQLDVEPARYFVVVTKREKRACKFCEEGGVAAAPAPVRIIRQEPGQRPGGDRHGGGQIQRPCAVVSAERDPGAGDGPRAQPRDAGWMGDAGGRATHSRGRGDGP